MVNPCVMTGSSSAVRPFHTSNSTQRHPARSTCLYISTEELPASWPAKTQEIKTLWQQQTTLIPLVHVVKINIIFCESIKACNNNNGYLLSFVYIVYWFYNLQSRFSNKLKKVRIKTINLTVCKRSKRNHLHQSRDTISQQGMASTTPS